MCSNRPIHWIDFVYWLLIEDDLMGKPRTGRAIYLDRYDARLLLLECSGREPTEDQIAPGQRVCTLWGYAVYSAAPDAACGLAETEEALARYRQHLRPDSVKSVNSVSEVSTG